MANKSIQSLILLQARLGRRNGRRIKQGTRYGWQALNKTPVFFANSFPKSGTHLLTQVLAGFAQIGPAVISGLPAVVTFDGRSGRQRSQGEILGDLKRLLPGDIAYGHLHALPESIKTLCGKSFATYFILRDPRDVVVSHVHYVSEMAPNHILHDYYHNTLGNFDERLKASIKGIRSSELRVRSGNIDERNRAGDKHSLPEEILPDIYQRFEPYLGWLEQPELLTLQFESFIIEPEVAIGKVFDHAADHGFETKISRAAAIQVLSNNINPQRSPTFRSGKIGSWRTGFSQEHKEIFKEVSGGLLVRLGYEESNDW